MRDLMKPPLRIFALHSALAAVFLCGIPRVDVSAGETNASMLVLWGMPE